jgi:predicted transcriptional regulator
MDATKAFNLTIELFKLRPTDIAKNSGIAKSAISDFQHGNRDLRVKTMQKLVSGFPPEAKMYFYSLISIENSESGEEQAPKEAIAA